MIFTPGSFPGGSGLGSGRRHTCQVKWSLSPWTYREAIFHSHQITVTFRQGLCFLCFTWKGDIWIKQWDLSVQLHGRSGNWSLWRLEFSWALGQCHLPSNFNGACCNSLQKLHLMKHVVRSPGMGRPPWPSMQAAGLISSLNIVVSPQHSQQRHCLISVPFSRAFDCQLVFVR